MFLDDKTICSLMRNCLSVEKTENGLLPLRFTERQLGVYSSEPTWKIRSRCPSGVCIDMVGDIGSLAIDYATGGKARDWAYFDLYVDGALTAQQGSKPSRSPDRVEFKILGERKERRLTVYLPHCLEIFIRGIELQDDVSFSPAPHQQRKLLMIGDSITQGMESFYPSSIYPVQVARFLDAELLNHGIGGYFFDEQVIDETMPFIPDLVTVAYGANDWNRFKELSDFRSACSAFVEKLTSTYNHVPVFVITPIWRSDHGDRKECGTFEDIADTITDCCRPYSKIKIVDGMKLVPHLPEYFGDGTVHPNDAGFAYYAINLLKAMQAIKI